MPNSEFIIDYQYGILNPVQFGHEDCLPGHFYGPAVRTNWLLHYVVSGCGIFVREGITHKVNPGEIFVIPPYSKTYYEADRENPWNYIWVGFTTHGPTPDVFAPPILRCHGAAQIFEEMMHCRHMENGRSAYLAGCLWKLVGLLLEQSETRTDYVDQAIRYMQTGYPDGITVQEIAHRLNLDRSYLYTLFSKKMHCSPQEYLINLRLTKAAELMVSYGESPSTAAASVGYPDIYQFSKIFKKHFGLSPKAYIASAGNMSAPILSNDASLPGPLS